MHKKFFERIGETSKYSPIPFTFCNSTFNFVSIVALFLLSYKNRVIKQVLDIYLYIHNIVHNLIHYARKFKWLFGHPVILLPTKYLDHNIYISAKAYYYLSLMP